MLVSSAPVLATADPAELPFTVIDRSGNELGRSERLAEALEMFSREDDAAAVIVGSYLVTDRKGGAAI